jgi:hypothetical protein
MEMTGAGVCFKPKLPKQKPGRTFAVFVCLREEKKEEMSQLA